MTDVNAPKVAALCSTFLGGPWMNAAPGDIEVKEFSVGICNRNYYCAYTGKGTMSEIPSQVVVHLYGNELDGEKSSTKRAGEAAEAVVVNTLSNLGMAPKLYGVFPGGRIEQYLPNTEFTKESVYDRELLKKLAHKLAKFHSLNMPLAKKPDFMQGLKNLRETCRARYKWRYSTSSFDDAKEEEQLEWFDKVLNKISSRPVFIHGDLNPSNLLVVDGPDGATKDIMLIDYEFCGYYFRGYDLAMFFHFMRRKIERVNGRLKVSTCFERDIQVELTFMKDYLDATRRINGAQSYSLTDTLEHLMQEVEVGEIICTLSFLLWFRSVPPSAYDDSGGYTKHLLDTYATKKSELIEKYNVVCNSVQKSKVEKMHMPITNS